MSALRQLRNPLDKIGVCDLIRADGSNCVKEGLRKFTSHDHSVLFGSLFCTTCRKKYMRPEIALEKTSGNLYRSVAL
jgi:hypothetical protein